jgi:hypothetical protein
VSGRALVVLRDRRAFEGEAKLVGGGIAVTVDGRERRLHGAVGSGRFAYGQPGVRTFPLDLIREIRWEAVA